MKINYRTIDTSTLRGLVLAERLQDRGWKIGSVGFSTVQLYLEKKEEAP